MKIAWFSPLPPERSEIANSTQRISEGLRAEFETHFFTERGDNFLEVSTGRLYPTSLGNPSSTMWLRLNNFDLPVYNLGNNPLHFSHTWFLNQVKPGIIVLHDLKLHHFFEGIYRERIGDQAAYLRWITKDYGPRGYEAGLAYWRQEVSINFMAEHFPMTAWAIRGALGVVVHHEHALSVVRSLTDVPAVVAPLPYATRTGERAKVPLTADQRARIVIFGHLNVNRRIVEFLHALAGMPERGRFEVDIFGEMLHRHEVEAVLQNLGLGAQVTLHGYVPDTELEQGLNEADLAVNLRFPSMGEASASQLRIWDHALPSLVTRTEGYAELPADAVFFVRPEHEAADIQRHLRDLLHQPERFLVAGRRGQEWLCTHHRPETYVERVGGLCRAANELRSRRSRLDQADRVGAAIAPWADVLPVTAREERYAAEITALL